MSTIAVEGLPLKISLVQVRMMLAKSVRGPIEDLNFGELDGASFKTCFLQLSDKLDPVEVVERINSMSHGKKKNILYAYIPDDNIPHLAFGKKAKTSMKLQKKTTPIERDNARNHILSTAHLEIMTELQHKYTGLYSLSSKGSHALLEAIGMTVHERLKQLQASGDQTSNSFQQTGRYRKAHPHFGDFQLILDTLHRLEDAAGAPRTQLQESDLTVTPKDLSVINDLPYTETQEIISKYTDRIVKKLEDHVSKYDLTANPEDSREEAARKKVQAQVAKLVPYLPTIMKQIVTNNFAEDCRMSPSHRMRMYGEPHLPGKELTLPLMKRVYGQRVTRWKTMFNLLAFNVPLNNYSKIMAMDGTSLGGCKIVIRSYNPNVYRGTYSKKSAIIKTMALEDEEGADNNMEQ